MDLSEESSPVLTRPPSRASRAVPPSDTAVSRFLHWAVEDADEDVDDEELWLDDEVTEPTLVLPTFQRWWGPVAVRDPSEG
jgi:hypothetical protein